MTTLYILGALILVALIINFIKKKVENNSPYLKIMKKLNEDLLQANFSNDWKRTQEINLQLLWLESLVQVERLNNVGRAVEFNEKLYINNLTIHEIQLPQKWTLNDLSCFPFSQQIINSYRKVLATNEYKGVFKPESILPVPKKYIKKAILFSFDYFNLKDPLYEIPNKDEQADNLNTINFWLGNFIDNGDIDLPKSGIENYHVGNALKEEVTTQTELEEFNLIDWRNDNDWMIRGAHYADEKRYDYAFACYEKARKINPKNENLKSIPALTYLKKGEEHYDNGEIELAFENIKKAAELNNEEAIKWLEEHLEV